MRSTVSSFIVLSPQRTSPHIFYRVYNHLQFTCAISVRIMYLLSLAHYTLKHGLKTRRSGVLPVLSNKDVEMERWLSEFGYKSNHTRRRTRPILQPQGIGVPHPMGGRILSNTEKPRTAKICHGFGLGLRTAVDSSRILPTSPSESLIIRRMMIEIWAICGAVATRSPVVHAVKLP